MGFEFWRVGVSTNIWEGEAKVYGDVVVSVVGENSMDKDVHPRLLLKKGEELSPRIKDDTYLDWAEAVADEEVEAVASTFGIDGD